MELEEEAPRPLLLDVASRAEHTLRIMHEWGYAPTLQTLASDLVGGNVSLGRLSAALQGSVRIRLEGGFVFLRGHEALVDDSRRRTAADRTLNGQARTIAKEFARDLASLCPMVECICLSGSVASGGYEPGDDIDFDLFVEPGTKYVCYLLATLLGIRYSLRYRDLRTSRLHRTPFLPKITCVNVVWPGDQTRPFSRQDTGLAFELLRCQPLHGARRFQDVLQDNPWVLGFFPQIRERVWFDSIAARPSRAGHLVKVVAKRPRLLRIVERASRTVAWLLYTTVQAVRARRDPIARARMEFLRRVKSPYEVFQD